MNVRLFLDHVGLHSTKKELPEIQHI